MKWTLNLAAVLAIGLIVTSSAQAGYPWSLFDRYRSCCMQHDHACRSQPCWCCDDYCPKAMPCVPPNYRGCVDDYCGKALPCVPCNTPGCVDDYCPKSCPRLLWSQCQPWYSCGPPERSCGKIRITFGCDAVSHD